MTLQLMILADWLETPKFVSPLVCGRPGQIDSLSKSSCCCHRLNFPGGGDPSTAWPGQRPPAPADIWNQFWRRSGGGGGHHPVGHNLYIDIHIFALLRKSLLDLKNL